MFAQAFFESNKSGLRSPAARKLGDEYPRAARRARRRRLVTTGGSVDVPAALCQLIEYIDRKERGVILFAQEQGRE